MTDRASVNALGWILTVEASPLGRRRGSSSQVWFVMYPEADQAIAAVRKTGSVSKVAIIEAHQPISSSLASALNLISGQIKRFG